MTTTADPRPWPTSSGWRDDLRVIELEKREEAWKQLVRYLCDSGGFAPEYGAKGLWVDLYDEATMNEAAGLVDGAHSDGITGRPHRWLIRPHGPPMVCATSSSTHSPRTAG